ISQSPGSGFRSIESVTGTKFCTSPVTVSPVTGGGPSCAPRCPRSPRCCAVISALAVATPKSARTIWIFRRNIRPPISIATGLKFSEIVQGVRSHQKAQKLKTSPATKVWPGACRFMVMKPITILGIVLIAFGVFVLASQGITYTKTEKVLDIGPIQATTQRQKTIPISPVAGGLILAAGVVLVVAGTKRR